MFNSEWYKLLNQPPLNPPSGIFAPVWTILYVLILISVLLYANTPSEYDKGKGYLFFAIQIVLNLLWTPIFFIFKNITAAFVTIILLVIFICFNMKEFFKVSKIAGLILIPYLIWVLFATYLNFGFMILN